MINEKLKKNTILRQSPSHLTIMYSIYFLLAPFEDLLNFGAGTILKYIGALIVLFTIEYMIRTSQKININDFRIILPLLMVLVSWISVLWSSRLSITFDRNITYTLLPILFIITSNIFFNKKDLKIIEFSIIFGGLGIFIFILVYFRDFYELNYYRFSLSGENDPNNLAAHLILPLFVAINLSFGLRKFKKYLMYIIVLSILFAILMTGSRGALVSIILGFISILFFSKVNFFRSIFYLLIFVFVFIVIIKLLPNFIYDRIFILNNYLRDFSNYDSRSAIWIITITKIIPNSLPLGLGSGILPYELAYHFGDIKAAHNTYLNMIGEYGFLGIPIFTVFLVKLSTIIKKRNTIIMGGFVAMLAIIFFLDSYPKKYFWNYLFFLTIYINQIKNNHSFNN